jgi:hypothetical protein
MFCCLSGYERRAVPEPNRRHIFQIYHNIVLEMISAIGWLSSLAYL